MVLQCWESSVSVNACDPLVLWVWLLDAWGVPLRPVIIRTNVVRGAPSCWGRAHSCLQVVIYLFVGVASIGSAGGNETTGGMAEALSQ